MNSSHSRIHYMDNLRALLMILGVFFHAALAYSPLLHPVWLTADDVNTPVVDYLCNFLHIFRMPLFFAVAGFFAALLVQRRGTKAMLSNRAKRVLLPFILFWPLVALSIVLSMGWVLENIDNLSPLLQMVAAMANMPDAPQPPPTLMHLWFLYYLVFFYVLVWVATQIIPTAVKDGFAALHPVTAVVVLPLLLLPGLAATTAPFPAPESFIPQFWAFGFYGLFFAYGYVLYGSFKLVDYFTKSWPLLVLASVLVFVPLQYLYPKEVSFTYVGPPWPTKLVMMLCVAYISVFMSVAGLAFAKAALNKRSTFMRYMSDASYWVYIVHLPILFAVQYWLLGQPGGLMYKYSISILATLGVSTVSYLLVVRWTPIGWLLNGRRARADLGPNKPSEMAIRGHS